MAIQISISNAVGSRDVVSSGGGFDPDAQAFITAAAITDPTQQNAINTLVVDLKGYSIWTKFKAIYPIVGGSASSHKFNLKDPRDLDAAFRLAFATGWTHSVNGMTPSVAWADTFFNPTTGFAVNDNVHLSYYSRTNLSISQVEIGSANTFVGPYLMLQLRASGTTYYIINSNGTYATSADSDSRAFYVGNRIGVSEKGFRNNLNVVSRASTANLRPNFNTYIGAANFGNVANYYSTKQCAFSSIGDGLTDTEIAQFSITVEKYQTALGRSMNPWYDNGTLLLDTYSGSSASYSLRKLRNFYIGAAIRVRRSSDNVEQDIYFNSAGTLDTSSLLTFCGAGNGFVVTWYDQSGNGANVTQSIATQQPQIVSSGSVITQNSKSVVQFDGSNDILSSSNLSGGFFNTSQFNVLRIPSSISEDIPFGYGNTGDSAKVRVMYCPPTQKLGYATWGTDYSGTLNSLDTNLYMYGVTQVSSAIVVNKNNIQVTGSLIGTPQTSIAGKYSIGSLSGGAVASYYTNMYGAEFIFYPSDQTINRTGIQNNINSFYTLW